MPPRADDALDVGWRNVRGGLVLLSGGLLLGLVMSVYAFVPLAPPPSGFQAYGDLPRRLVRLAHIAAIMLPLLNVAIGGWIDRLALGRRAKEWASLLLLSGAAGLPAALLVEAALPWARALHVSGPPALAFCSGVWITAWGALRRREGLAPLPQDPPAAWAGCGHAARE
jgi:hypothetical protein